MTSRIQVIHSRTCGCGAKGTVTVEEDIVRERNRVPIATSGPFRIEGNVVVCDNCEPVKTQLASYLAIIEPAGIGFGVYFPDIPGCVSAGATIEEATLNASGALSEHLAALTRDGRSLPPANAKESRWEESEGSKVTRVMITPASQAATPH